MTVSAETLAPGSAATVERIDHEQDFELHFGLPSGAVGPQGSPGETGPQGEPGIQGERGGRVLKVTSLPNTKSGTIEDISYNYRMPLSLILTQSGATEVLVGDIIFYSYYYYSVVAIDDTYAYMKTRVDIRGPQGPQGPQGPAGSGGGGTIIHIQSSSGLPQPDGQTFTITHDVSDVPALYTNAKSGADNPICIYDDGSNDALFFHLMKAEQYQEVLYFIAEDISMYGNQNLAYIVTISSYNSEIGCVKLGGGY